MILKELIETFRDLADDKSEPYKWSDTEVAKYLSEAENEAAIRALLLYDDETSKYCSIAVVAGTARYSCQPGIVKITRARLTTARVDLVLTDEKELDRNVSDWDISTNTGTPSYLITRPRKLRLVSAPAVADTLQLSVYRLPLKPLTEDTSTPEIAPQHHFRLLDWALHLAYLKHDADVFDEDFAAAHAAKFTASFGPHPGIDVLTSRHHRRGAPVTRYGGY